MKRIVTILLSTLLALSLIACGGNDEPEETVAEVEEAEVIEEVVTEEETIEEEVENKIVIGEPIELEFGTVTVQGYEIVQDWDGNDCLKIVYDYVNSTDESYYPDDAYFVGFQNSVELEHSPLSDHIDYGIGQKEVRSGGEVSGVETGVILDDDSVITLELSYVWSMDNNTWTAEIDPSSL